MLWLNAVGKLSGKLSGAGDQTKPALQPASRTVWSKPLTAFYGQKASFFWVLLSFLFACWPGCRMFLGGKKSGNGLWESHLISHSWQTALQKRRQRRRSIRFCVGFIPELLFCFLGFLYTCLMSLFIRESVPREELSNYPTNSKLLSFSSSAFGFLKWSSREKEKVL